MNFINLCSQIQGTQFGPWDLTSLSIWPCHCFFLVEILSSWQPWCFSHLNSPLSVWLFLLRSFHKFFLLNLQLLWILVSNCYNNAPNKLSPISGPVITGVYFHTQICRWTVFWSNWGGLSFQKVHQLDLNPCCKWCSVYSASSHLGPSLKCQWENFLS